MMTVQEFERAARATALRHATSLDLMHARYCEEQGEHPEEFDTCFSTGADHIRWSGGLKEQLAMQRRRANAAMEALKLHAAYEAMPTDRGGKKGPKGIAWTSFIEARDAALAIK